MWCQSFKCILPGIYYDFYFQVRKHETQWVKSFVQLGDAASSGQGQTWKPLRLAESVQSSGCWSGAKSQLLNSSQLNPTPPQGAGLSLQGLGWITERVTGPSEKGSLSTPTPAHAAQRVLTATVRAWPICADLYATP